MAKSKKISTIAESIEFQITSTIIIIILSIYGLIEFPEKRVSIFGFAILILIFDIIYIRWLRNKKRKREIEETRNPRK